MEIEVICNNQSLQIPSETLEKSIPLQSQLFNEHEVSKNNGNETFSKMTLRKKIRPAAIVKSHREKVVPKNETLDINNEERLKDFYVNVNKNVKIFPRSSLETIFEEPQNNLHKTIYIGARKLKRSLNLKSGGVASKIKKRKARIKKFFGKKRTFKSITNAQLHEQLAILDTNEE